MPGGLKSFMEKIATRRPTLWQTTARKAALAVFGSVLLATVFMWLAITLRSYDLVREIFNTGFDLPLAWHLFLTELKDDPFSVGVSAAIGAILGAITGLCIDDE